MKLEELVIIDIEATCWEKKKKPPGENSEIIEIGICLFDLKQWRPIDRHQIIILPTESTVSRFCTDLTGWTLTDLRKEGVPFRNACIQLRNVYNTKNKPWGSWGKYDRLAFERQCKRRAVEYPFNNDHLNLKTLFAIHFGLAKSVSMKEALKLSELQLEGRHHCGIDDAWNVGRILEKQGRF